MSLLLEALKKAALEKQSKADLQPAVPNSPSITSPEIPLSQSPSEGADSAIREIVEGQSDEEISSEQQSIEQEGVKQPAFDRQAEEPADWDQHHTQTKIDLKEHQKIDQSSAAVVADKSVDRFNDTLDTEDAITPIIEEPNADDNWDNLEDLSFDELEEETALETEFETELETEPGTKNAHEAAQNAAQNEEQYDEPVDALDDGMEDEYEEVGNFDFESAPAKPTAPMELEETEHALKEAKHQQEALLREQEKEKEEIARALAEEESRRASQVAEEQAKKSRQALDQLISSGKAVARRSRRRAVFLYGLLVMTALGGILSYYFYLLANSSIAELKQAPIVEAQVDVAELIETTALTPEATGEIDSQMPNAADAAENLKLQGSISQVTQLDEATDAEGTRTNPATPRAANSTTTPAASRNAQAETLVARRVDPPPSAAAYLRPLITSDERGSQTTNLAERVIIHHPNSSQKLGAVLKNAYSALQQRDLKTAASLYEQALAINPNQRDALLGAASTATALGRFDDATVYYQRRLNADPNDSFARAGMLGLLSNGKSRATVQREVTTLLEDNPRSSQLHFLKGVGFAAEGRWQQAQSAFYDAYSIDNDNPDYAFNLAVSLDHLSQPPLARVYYERAQNLAKNRPANFDVGAIQQRLQELSQP